MPEGVTDVFTGGGPVFPDVMRTLAGQCRLTAVYGSTEAEPIAEISASKMTDADWAAMAAGNGLLVGEPVAAVDVRLVDDEVWVTGPHVNNGYLDPADDAANKVNQDGQIWHRTGDAGRLDAAGRLWLLGRHGARVRVGDNWLYPFQIEAAARLWAGVRRAALVEIAQRPVLAIESDFERDWPVPDGIEVQRVTAIPMDARHESKVNLTALKALLK